MIQEKVYIVSTSYAVFALITQAYNTTVIDAAPIAKWTIGKNIARALLYYTKKDATIHLERIRYDNK